MNNAEKVERASGPITFIGLLGYLILQFGGALPTPGVSRIEKDVDRVIERVGKIDERLVLAEKNIDRIGLGIENNREFITNTAVNLREINSILNEIQIAIVRIDVKMNEIDRRTGSNAGGRGPQ